MGGKIIENRDKESIMNFLRKYKKVI